MLPGTGYGSRGCAAVKSENKRTRTLSRPLAQGYETLFKLHTRTGRRGRGGLSTLLLPAYVLFIFDRAGHDGRRLSPGLAPRNSLAF